MIQCVHTMSDIPVTSERRRNLLPMLWGALIMFTLCTGAFVFLYLEHDTITTELTTTNEALEAELASTTDALASTTENLVAREAEMVELSEMLNETREDLQEERDRNEAFREQLEDLTGTVSTLDRLSQLDRELLQKYSRTSFLNENYRPAQLTQIPDRWVLEGRTDQYFLPDAWPFLEDMLRDAARDDIDLRVLSAFRSFDEQRDLHGQFQQQFGSGANQFSADQGFSEHQLGTAVDIVDPDTGAATQAFANTEAYEWLQDNAHEYGFILSYPEGNQFYIFEPWHWRFVGVELATDLHRAGDHFYDWDQREINEYLISIFD